MGVFGKAIQNTWTNVKGVVLTKDVMARIGQDQARQIIQWNRESTAKGIDINGVPFAPYTKGYSEYKRKHRLPGLGRLVNLEATGALNKSRTFILTRTIQKGFTLEIGYTLTVDDDNQKKLKGLTTGKLGRTKRPPRESVGLAKPGSSLRRRQDSTLKSIASTGLKLPARARGFIIQDNKR